MRQHAAVELSRGYQCGFAVYVAVDKPGNSDPAPGVDFFPAAITVERAHDGAAAHRNVSRLQLTADQVENPGIADDQVGGLPSEGLIDLSLKYFPHVHSPWSQTGMGSHPATGFSVL